MAKLKDLKAGQSVTEKLSKEVVKQTKLEVIYLVPAYTGSVKNKDLVFQGAVECTVPVASEEALDHWRKKLTVKDLEDLARQRISDTKNGVRTEESEESILAQIKTAPDFASKIKLIGKLAKVNPNHPLVIKTRELL